MMRTETTHTPQLEEVDIESPPNDHWGDYKEMQSPYESSVAAQKQTTPVASDAHADPEEVKDDFGRYAAAPYGASPVKPVATDSWHANDFMLSDGQTKAVEIAEYDPYRAYVTIINHCDNHVFISPNPNGVSGWGSMRIAGTLVDRPPAQVTLHTRSKIYLFTETGFVAGNNPIVSVVMERYA